MTVSKADSRCLALRAVWWCFACCPQGQLHWQWSVTLWQLRLSGDVLPVCLERQLCLALGAVWWWLACCPQGWLCVQWNVTLWQLGLSGNVLPVVCNDDGAGSGLLYPHSWGCLVTSCLLSAMMTVLAVDCCTLTAGVVWWCLACCLQWQNRMCSGQSFPDGDGYLETRRMRWEYTHNTNSWQSKRHDATWTSTWRWLSGDKNLKKNEMRINS